VRKVPPQRVVELVDGFASHVDDGKPAPDVDRDEAAAISRYLLSEIDRGVEARNQKVAELGRTVACHSGCADCCYTVIFTSEPDAILVAQWLGHPDRAAIRARFVAAYARWRAEGGAMLDHAAGAGADRDAQRVKAFMYEAGVRRLMCPFNHDGACDIYPVRPDTCRIAHALDTDQNCVPGRTAEILDFVPLTRFLQRVRPLHQAIQDALPGAPAGRVVLAERVHALLVAAQPPTGRNDPCPCGSGKKYKRCCGAS
jgi:Fe-S-cluster containining protein